MKLMNLDGDILHEDANATSMKELVMSARKSGVSLYRSNLSGSNLSGSDLRDSDLRGSDLRGSNLSGSNLRGSDLRGSNLRGSDLRGVPKIPAIHQEILKACTAGGCSLDMGRWHTCQTTHCRAGWVIHLAGPAGAALEWAMGTPAAAAIIYLASDPSIDRIPNFYATNETAMADIEKCAKEEMVKATP